jgi:hypothetical protein
MEDREARALMEFVIGNLELPCFTNSKLQIPVYFFFFFAGLLLPKLPLLIFPFLVFLSPLPMILFFSFI